MFREIKFFVKLLIKSVRYVKISSGQDRFKRIGGMQFKRLKKIQIIKR